MRDTKFIAITSQKGGPGKTTFNIMLSSCFHFLGKLDVVLIDCDQPQINAYKLRQQELDELVDNPEKEALFESQDRPAYPVLSHSLEETVVVMDALKGKVDLVFVDMPGTVNNPDLPPIWARLDYIFIPMEGDIFNVQATEGFVAIIRHYILKLPNNRLKGYYAFWNKHRKSIKQEYFTEVEEYFQEQEIPMLATKVEDSIVYQRREMRSTLFPPEAQNAGRGLIQLLREVSAIIFSEAKQSLELTEAEVI